MSLRRNPWWLSAALLAACAAPQPAKSVVLSRRVPMLLIALTLLAGCGFKGDLVHPDADAPQPDKAEPAERDPVPE